MRCAVIGKESTSWWSGALQKTKTKNKKNTCVWFVTLADYFEPSASAMCDSIWNIYENILDILYVVMALQGIKHYTTAGCLAKSSVNH